MAFYNPTIITIPWAANGQKAAIPNSTEAAGRASWPVGFPEVNALPLAAGGIPPNYLDFQGVLYALSVHAMYGQTGARYAWNSAIDYPVGSYVRGSNGVEYVAIAASGPDSGGAVDPAGGNSSAYWTKALTAAALDDYLKRTGGQMSGAIATRGNAIVGIDNTGYVQICGGEGYGYGSSIAVYAHESENPGLVRIHATNRTTARNLDITPDYLRWGGTDVEVAKVGEIIALAGSSSPSGYLFCNGAPVSRTTYAGLFAAIGTKYGAGDGSTTFNLPDLVDKFVMGSSSVGLKIEPGLPNITGSITRTYATAATSVGALSTGEGIGGALDEGSNNVRVLSFDASQSNRIYGSSTTVQPPAVTMRYYIRY